MKNDTKISTIVEIGIFAAIGYVLDELQSILTKGIFINGGSIGFAMIAVIIIAFRRGAIPALLTGLIMGLLDLSTGSYILHPAQLMLDYVLPYVVVGLVGLLRPMFTKTSEKKSKILWLIAGTIIGGLLKLTSHYLAGVIFWADPKNFAWGLSNMNPYIYCLIYNFAFIGPSIVLTAILLVGLFSRMPRILESKEGIIKSEKKVVKTNYSGLYLIGGIISGLAIFIIFLIKYINSFSDYTDGGAYGYDFDPDSMVIFVLGFMIAATSLISLILYFKNKYSPRVSKGIIITIFACAEIYGIARLIRMYVKNKNPDMYRMWIAVVAVSLFILILSFIEHNQLKERMSD